MLAGLWVYIELIINGDDADYDDGSDDNDEDDDDDNDDDDDDDNKDTYGNDDDVDWPAGVVALILLPHLGKKDQKERLSTIYISTLSSYINDWKV